MFLIMDDSHLKPDRWLKNISRCRYIVAIVVIYFVNHAFHTLWKVDRNKDHPESVMFAIRYWYKILHHILVKNHHTHLIKYSKETQFDKMCNINLVIYQVNEFLEYPNSWRCITHFENFQEDVETLLVQEGARYDSYYLTTGVIK